VATKTAIRSRRPSNSRPNRGPRRRRVSRRSSNHRYFGRRAEAAAGPGRKTAKRQPSRFAVSIDTIAKGFAQLSAQGGRRSASQSGPTSFYHNARVYVACRRYAQRQARLSRLCRLRCRCHRSLYALCHAAFGSRTARPAPRSVRHAGRKGQGAVRSSSSIFCSSTMPSVSTNSTPSRCHPNYAPLYFLLAQEFSEDRLGSQTLADSAAKLRR